MNTSSRATLTGSPSFSQPLQNTANALIFSPLGDVGLFSTFVMIVYQSFYDGRSPFEIYHVCVRGIQEKEKDILIFKTDTDTQC